MNIYKIEHPSIPTSCAIVTANSIAEAMDDGAMKLGVKLEGIKAKLLKGEESVELC